MTVNQYLRFLTAINTKKPDETYDQVAQRVVAMDKTEDATKKP